MRQNGLFPEDSDDCRTQTPSQGDRLGLSAGRDHLQSALTTTARDSQQRMDCGPHATLLFSDLDGCLLNKSDYDYRPALPALKRAVAMEIPVVLASSKTAAEMVPIAQELQIPVAPLICENGGIILWRGPGAERREVTGVSRTEILSVLDGLKADYPFRSFRDLQLKGIMAATSLPEDKAALAADRHSTEPLLWDGSPEQLESFSQRLRAAGLSFTRGGRFFHVAGTATKGGALQKVAAAAAGDRVAAPDAVRVIAVGDSPIDQSMLDLADYAVCIPAPDGTLNVHAAADRQRIASQPGAAGWAEAIHGVLDELQQASTGK